MGNWLAKQLNTGQCDKVTGTLRTVWGEDMPCENEEGWQHERRLRENLYHDKNKRYENEETTYTTVQSGADSTIAGWGTGGGYVLGKTGQIFIQPLTSNMSGYVTSAISHAAQGLGDHFSSTQSEVRHDYMRDEDGEYARDEEDKLIPLYEDHYLKPQKRRHTAAVETAGDYKDYQKLLAWQHGEPVLTGPRV